MSPFHQKLLPEVRIKDKHLSQLESLANTRDKFVKLRTAMKNKIHNLLLGEGILSKEKQFSSEKSLTKVLEYELSELPKFELQMLVEQIRNLNKSIKKIDEQIEAKGKELPGFENLTSIKGIGKKSASILLSIIGNIDDFESEKKLSAFFGIVPRVHNSNGKNHHGKITKRGSKVGRTTLVQCSLIAMRYSPYLKNHFEKVKKNRGGGKAIIATSRKMLGIIYNTLKEDWVFEDFTNFVLKT